MKKLGLAASEIALGLSVGAVTYDGKVVDGDKLVLTWAKKGLSLIIR